MDNREKAKEIVESHPMYKELQQHVIEFGFDSALKMAIWKDSQWEADIISAIGCDTCNSPHCEDCQYKIIKRKLLYGAYK